MQNTEGLFIAIEGIDGAGKGTQFEILAKRLDLAGFDTVQMDFPRYDEPSSYFVKQYLNGQYGGLDDVGPYTASLFYALDRFEAAKYIREALKSGKVVLSNRFTGSNMAHQGTKFRNADERRGFFIWLDNLEFEMLHIPRPDLNLVLRVPADIAQNQVDKKPKRNYTDNKRDLHESNIDHLRLTADVYDDMCQLFPRDYVRVDCVRSAKMLPQETIANLVWEKVHPLLPKPSRSRKSANVEVPPTKSVISSDVTNSNQEMTDQQISRSGEALLSKIVTDTVKPIYYLTDNLNSVNKADALSEISGSKGKLREILMEKFKGTDPTGDKLKSVFTEIRVSNILQLTGLHAVAENISSLLAGKIEMGRLANYSYLPPEFSEHQLKDAAGNYNYYVPQNLDEETSAQYRQHMNRIFDLYAEMLKALIAHLDDREKTSENVHKNNRQNLITKRAIEALRSVLPLASCTTIGIFASAYSIQYLVKRLLQDDLQEAREAGEIFLEQAQKNIPPLFESLTVGTIAKTSYTQNTVTDLRKIAAQYLPSKHSDHSTQSADLLDYWPRNELSIAADCLFELSTAPLRDLQNLIEDWTYDKKAKVLMTYLGERQSVSDIPGRAFEKVHYSWEIICDYSTYRELQQHRMIDSLELQPVTPRNGYDIPAEIEEAGLSTGFEQCFDTSLKLYSVLQQAGYPLEAQYATLHGHKLRWKVTFNAREAYHILGTEDSISPNPNVNSLIKQMREKVAEVHPLIARSFKVSR
jgi:dTMP kinase